MRLNLNTISSLRYISLFDLFNNTFLRRTTHTKTMGFRFPQIVKAKHLLQRSLSSNPNQAASYMEDVPKGYLAVYVGDSQSEMRRFVIPISCLNHASFQDLLSQSEEEFGFKHPMGVLTIPCSEDTFVDLISRFSA